MLDTTPTSEVDIFSDAVLTNPWETLATLRGLAPVVELPDYDVMIALSHAAVKTALSSHETFISGEGVGINAILNMQMSEAIICSDGDQHTKLRRAATRELSAPKMRQLADDVQTQVFGMVDDVLGKGPVNAIEALCIRIPMEIVGEMIGLDEEGKSKVVDWASYQFNGFGPVEKERTLANIESVVDVLEYSVRAMAPGFLRTGSLGHAIVQNVEGGDLTDSEGAGLIAAYLSGGIDTTVASVGNLLELLAQNPDQFDLLKANPDLAPQAVQELLRIRPPGMWFARMTAEDTVLDSVPVPEGTRIMLNIAAANHDPAVFPDPERFDITRENLRDHLAFGHGRHVCAGQFIAKLELESLVRALATKVGHIEIIEAAREPNNVIFGHGTLTVSLS